MSKQRRVFVCRVPEALFRRTYDEPGTGNPSGGALPNLSTCVFWPGWVAGLPATCVRAVRLSKDRLKCLLLEVKSLCPMYGLLPDYRAEITLCQTTDTYRTSRAGSIITSNEIRVKTGKCFYVIVSRWKKKPRFKRKNRSIQTNRTRSDFVQCAHTNSLNWGKIICNCAATGLLGPRTQPTTCGGLYSF